MKKRILALTISVLVVLAVLIVPMLVLAGNEATQEASTTYTTTIAINAQNYTSTVTNITFPEGALGDTVSVPYNDIDTASSPQVLGGSPKPVVTLVNAGTNLNIWYTISTWTPAGVVASEGYVIVAKTTACADVAAIKNNAVIDGTLTVDADGTVIGSGASTEKDLYLKVTLASAGGGTATSTLTILGETP